MEGRPHILLILKPSPAREALAQALTQEGWSVEATPSTFRGVSGLARQSREAVVLGLDDVMDEELEAIRVIRADCPECFILVTFSHVNRRKAQHALELGADAYVLEPLNDREVLAALRALAFRTPRPSVPNESAPAPHHPPHPDAAPAEERPSTPRRALRSEASPLKAQEIAERFPSLPRQTPLAAPQLVLRSLGEGGSPITNLSSEALAKEDPQSPVASDSPDRLVSLRALGASIAHEINNPLTTLSGWIQLLLRKANGNHDLHRTLISMKEEADRIADVVHELSALSKPASADSARSSADFNTLASLIIDNFLATNGNSSIQVKTVLTDEPLRVKVDADLVARAVSDFLNCRYLSIGSSGSLLLRTLRADGFAELHVYEPGSQVDLGPLHKALQSLDLNEGETIGQDLSLARAKQIIDSFGGSFRADSHLREGLSFVVKFPLAD